MNDLFKCNTLDEIQHWLTQQTDHGASLLAAFERLKNYQNAVEWNQLVLVCEAITMRGWGMPPFNQLVPVEAYCGKGLSGSFETALFNADWSKQAGNWRDWSKNGDSFNIYKGADTTNYGVKKLNSQRIPLPTNPFKIGSYISNCQQSVLPFVAELEQLKAKLDTDMRPDEYGDDFYVVNIRCSFSNHDDEHETVRTEYFHAESDVPANCESAYISVKPHHVFGKLSIKRERQYWLTEVCFTRAWGEMPLAKQKQAFSDDLQIIFTEFEARIAKKKLTYNAKQATLDAKAIIANWLTT